MRRPDWNFVSRFVLILLTLHLGKYIIIFQIVVSDYSISIDFHEMNKNKLCPLSGENAFIIKDNFLQNQSNTNHRSFKMNSDMQSCDLLLILVGKNWTVCVNNCEWNDGCSWMKYSQQKNRLLMKETRPS